MEQQKLKRKITAYLNTFIKSGKESIQTDELGIITANIYKQDYDRFLLASYDLLYTVFVKYKDNAYEIRFLGKVLIKRTSASNELSLSLLTKSSGERIEELSLTQSDKDDLAKYFLTIDQKLLDYVQRTDSFFDLN
jgi:hypothetical protein